MQKNGLTGNFSQQSVLLFQGNYSRFLLPLLLVLFCIAARGALLRDLWFDEALTVLNFAALETPGDIYNSYVIPNNQIVHSILLHWILKISPGIPLRIFPLICALLCGIAIWKNFRTSLGTIPLFCALAALMLSPCYVTYGTSLRGYMLAALLLIPALKEAMEFARTGKELPAVKYTLWSILAVGTMPGALAALVGAALYAMPLCGRKFYARWRTYLLLLLPVAAVGIFYAGNFSQLLQCARLGEGWRSGSAMIIALALGVVYTFLVLLPAALVGGTAALRRRLRGGKWQYLARPAIWLLPVMAALVFPVAPFPRVFFPMFPLFALLIAGGIKEVMALYTLRRRSGENRRVALLLIAVGVWAVTAFIPAVRLFLSPFASGAGQDDYIYCHYLRSDFTPGETAVKLAEISPPENNVPLFATFESDPWALSYASGRKIYFDGPRGKIAAMPSGSIAILHKKKDSVAKIGARFALHPEIIAETPMHYIVELRDEK